MSYKTSVLLKKAKEGAKAKKFVFFDDIFAHLGISSSTFYSHFPSNSSGYNELEAILQENKTLMKNGIRSKWYNCDNPNAWKYLYLLIGNQDERHALHGSKTENKTELSGATKVIFNFSDGKNRDGDPKISEDISESEEV